MVSPIFIVGSIAGWVMVTRAETSGKRKFVPAIGQQCHMNLCGEIEIADEYFGYLHAVKASIAAAGCKWQLCLPIVSGFLRENRPCVARHQLHRLAESRLCWWDSQRRVLHRRRF